MESKFRNQGRETFSPTAKVVGTSQMRDGHITMTHKHRSSVIPVAQGLSPVVRIKLRKAIGEAGPQKLDEFELIALRYFASPELAKVLEEVAELRQVFLQANSHFDEMQALDQLDRNRAEKGRLIALESAAVAKAKSLVRELRAHNLLVTVSAETVRPCDDFPRLQTAVN